MVVIDRSGDCTSNLVKSFTTSRTAFTGGYSMERTVRAALIQAKSCERSDAPIEQIKQAMIDKHVALLAEAARQGAQVVCLQELFYGPYFPAEQQTRWYSLTER